MQLRATTTAASRRHTRRTWSPASSRPDLAGTTEQLRGWFQPGSEFETRVAVVDGAPIGHVTVRGHQLVHLFVEPDHQKMGLGRRLLGHGEAMIAAAGHTDFELHARVENLAAIAFYENAAGL
jgi:ribosomal protein S18 acetylase RimI-like enzyme